MKIEIEITPGKSSITAVIKKNGVFFTEIGCADVPELFEILSTHEDILSLTPLTDEPS